MFRWWQAAAVFAVVGPANAADLSLQRIMLSSGGVGYFEYEAVVDGNSTLSLDVPLDQVDDILKSLVVYDDGGTVGEVTLPGREPLTQTFVDLPFDRAALDSAPALLNALQGAEVRVTGAKPMSGRLVRVVEETSRGADGLAIPRDRVTLLTDSGCRAGNRGFAHVLSPQGHYYSPHMGENGCERMYNASSSQLVQYICRQKP